MSPLGGPALATAECSSLPTRMAGSRSQNRRMSSAMPTGWLRIRSSTGRTLNADTRAWWSTARTPSRSLVLGPGTSAPPRPLLAGVEPERPGRREFAELVADHRLGDVDGHVLAAVVDGDGVADHVRDDGAPAGPRLDDPLLVSRVEIVDLLQQMVVDERSLFQAARHATPTSTSAHRGYGGDGRSASAIP